MSKTPPQSMMWVGSHQQVFLRVSVQWAPARDRTICCMPFFSVCQKCPKCSQQGSVVGCRLLTSSSVRLRRWQLPAGTPRGPGRGVRVSRYGSVAVSMTEAHSALAWNTLPGRHLCRPTTLISSCNLVRPQMTITVGHPDSWHASRDA